MNYLELCAKVQEKADVPGAEIAAVTGQVGILKRITGWVEDAWLDIQGSQDWWEFMMEMGTATLNAGTTRYYITNLLPDDFNYFWDKTVYLKLNGETVVQMKIIKWKDYSEEFLHADLTTGTPSIISISHNGQLYLDAIPDEDYDLEFDYQKNPQILAASLDVPTLPVNFHDVIWRKALVSYGEHYGAPEVYQPASLYLEERLQTLENRYLPKVYFRDNVYATG